MSTTWRLTLYDLRRGEVLGLRWSAVDLSAKTHTVNHSRLLAEDLAAGRIPTVRAIRFRFRVGQPRAQRVRAYLSTLVADDSGAR